MWRSNEAGVLCEASVQVPILRHAIDSILRFCEPQVKFRLVFSSRNANFLLRLRPLIRPVPLRIPSPMPDRQDLPTPEFRDSAS